MGTIESFLYALGNRTDVNEFQGFFDGWLIN